MKAELSCRVRSILLTNLPRTQGAIGGDGSTTFEFTFAVDYNRYVEWRLIDEEFIR